MKITDILKTFENLGFFIKEQDMPDIAFHVSQKFNGIPENEIKERYDRSWIITNSENRIIISENFEVYSDGIRYFDPYHKHYFFSIRDTISEIYHSNQLDDLYFDLLSYIYKNFDKSSVRDIKISILYEN